MTQRSPEAVFLAQLIDRPASDVRRTALPTDAFTAGPLRHVYRAILAASHDHATVSVEAVVCELRESGKLQSCGGRGAVESLVDMLGAMPLDGARVELVAHATRRVIQETSYALSNAAGDGRTRDAIEQMQASQRLIAALTDGSQAVALKSMRDHLTEYTTRAADGTKKAPAADVPVFGKAFGDVLPGAMVLIYGFSQSGKSWFMQYLEGLYAQAGFATLRLSCEDPDVVNSGRLMSEACDMDASHANDLRREDWTRILGRTAAPREEWSRRYIVEHTPQAETCAATIRTASAQAGVNVAFVDYAQLLRTATTRANDTPETRLTEAGAMLKDVAKECGVMLFLGSQATVRDPKPGKVFIPSPYDVKGGRSLYEMSEQAIALWSDKGARFAEIQKDKLRGQMGLRASVQIGRGGVITGMRPCDRETTSSAAPYGGRSDYHDA